MYVKHYCFSIFVVVDRYLLYSKTRPFYNKNGYFLENSNLGHVLRVNTVNNQFGYTDFEITDVIY